jgi:hypothetical protein
VICSALNHSSPLLSTFLSRSPTSPWATERPLLVKVNDSLGSRTALSGVIEKTGCSAWGT